MRLLAMFMIGLAHSNSSSGFIDVSSDCAVQRGVMSFFVALSQFPVSMFALISGYVCVSSQWKISRWLMLWAQVAFYVILLHLIARACGMELLGKYLLYELSPNTGAYWYFNAYTYLFLLMPFLNAGLVSVSQHKLRLGLLLLSACCLTGGAYHGYTVLLLMYLIGGYLRLYPVHIKSAYCLTAAILCMLLTAGYAFANRFDLVYTHSFLPTVILTLSLFLFFIRCPFQAPRFAKIITLLAPLSFGCYLLQCHPYVWRMVLNGVFHRLAAENPIPWVVGMTVVLFVLGLTLDAVRQFLFAWLGLKKWAEKADLLFEKSLS